MLRIITTICFCLLATMAISQVNPTRVEDLRREIDSTTRANKAYIDSLNQRRDSVQMQESLKSMDRNRDALISTMRERDEKQLRGAYIRIALGLAFAGLFIFSIIRNNKRKKQQQAKERENKS